MPYSCFRQLLVVEAELFLPFGILAGCCSCVLSDLVLLIFSILIALRPVDLSILKSDFAIDIHWAEKCWLVLRELGFQNLAYHYVVLLKILFGPWFLEKLLVFKFAWYGCQRRILFWCWIRLLGLDVALRHRVLLLLLPHRFRFESDLCRPLAWSSATPYVVRELLGSLLLVIPICGIHFLNCALWFCSYSVLAINFLNLC